MIFGKRTDCVVFSVGIGTIAVISLIGAFASGKYYEGAVCTEKEQEIYDAWESSLSGTEVPAELKHLAKLSYCSSGKSYLICEHQYAPGQCPPIALISMAAILIFLGWIGGIVVLVLLWINADKDEESGLFTFIIPLIVGIVQGLGGILIAFFHWRITEASGCDHGAAQTDDAKKQCHPIYRDELIDVAVTCALGVAFSMFLSLFKNDDEDDDKDTDTYPTQGTGSKPDAAGTKPSGWLSLLKRKKRRRRPKYSRVEPEQETKPEETEQTEEQQATATTTTPAPAQPAPPPA